MRDGCPFCDYEGPSRILWETGSPPRRPLDRFRGVFVIAPLRAVVPGHVLVIPRVHVANFQEDPVISALTMGAAAQYAQGRMADFNVITSVGAAATQTVEHLHVHLVPRYPDDGVALPWSPPGIYRNLSVAT